MKPAWLVALFEQSLESMNLPKDALIFEYPTALEHGDYATNIAMVLAKQAGKNPALLAQEIVASLPKHPWILDSSVAGPGFINIVLSPEYFHTVIENIVNHPDTYGQSSRYAGKKILVEHSSPNLFKPFHVGHMMNNAIGESLVRLMRASGASVHTMSFPSDISLGIAKAVFILLEKFGNNFVPDSVDVLGDAYVEGTKRYEDDEAIHTRVKEIADNLYAQKPSPEYELFLKCKKFNINYFEQVVGRLGSTFDSYIYESEAGEQGKEIVLKNIPNVFTESEGAIVYIPDESKKNIHTAVFINSQGNPTYEAKDIGLLSMKFEREHPDLSLFVTDYQQIPHFDVVLDAGEKINKEWSEKSRHIPHGRMSFKGQKMSSRLGGVPLASDIIDTVLEEVRIRSGQKNIDAETMDAIAIGAIKFAILRAKPGQNINFDPDTSLSFEGDSGPYLQYTHARICSMLVKAQAHHLSPKLSLQEPVSLLERIIHRFPSVAESAMSDYAPQHIVTYLLQLAQTFNTYYASHQFIVPHHPDISNHRLCLAEITKKFLKQGLELLAIHAPEKM
jgi:arginyl-tRNA synthetase